jgi:hypothetical protein
MRLRAQALSLLALVVSGAFSPTTSQAGDAVEPHATEVRGGAAAYYGGLFGPTNQLGAITLARRVAGPLAAELSVGQGVGNERRTGLQLGAALRVGAPMGIGTTHGLTCAIGAWRAQGPAYGGVTFAVGELAYAVHFSTGFVLLAGGGVGVVLNDSRTPPATDCGYLCPSLVPSPFRAGDVGPWARLEAGWSF